MSGPRLARLVVLGLAAAGTITIAAGAWVPAKAVVAQMLLERAFDRSLATGAPQRPWSWADMAPIARMSVPRLGIDRMVLDSGSGQAMAFGPTLLPGGAAIGGSGTTIVAAHRDTHFRFLRAVRTGDLIQLRGIDGRLHAYRVTGADIVRWDGYALADEGRGRLDLVTCYPFGAMGRGPLRYVVHAVALQPKTMIPDSTSTWPLPSA